MQEEISVVGYTAGQLNRLTQTGTSMSIDMVIHGAVNPYDNDPIDQLVPWRDVQLAEMLRGADAPQRLDARTQELISRSLRTTEMKNLLLIKLHVKNILPSQYRSFSDSNPLYPEMFCLASDRPGMQPVELSVVDLADDDGTQYLQPGRERDMWIGFSINSEQQNFALVFNHLFDEKCAQRSGG